MHIPESHTSQIWVPGKPRAPPGMPDKSERIATVKEHQPSAAARNANGQENWPHLEVIADFQKLIRLPNSV